MPGTFIITRTIAVWRWRSVFVKPGWAAEERSEPGPS